MQSVRTLATRPWALAVGQKGYGSLQQEALQPVYLDEENVNSPYGNLKIKENINKNEFEYVFRPTKSAARHILGKIREEALSNRVPQYGENIRVVPFPPAGTQENFNNGMGSFTSSPAVASGDCQDDDLTFNETTHDDLLKRCRKELAHLPSAIQRKFRKYSFQHSNPQPETESSEDIRILQWNHLSQTLGTKNDKFVCCPPEALDWSTRRWRLIEEILRYQPDIVCLQEVDHFNLLDAALGSVGYHGGFMPKPDSPCIYLADNNGPDGCAIFVNKSKFEVISESRRILEVWNVQSNQVVICLNLKHRETGKEIAVASTHLKARQGALLSTLRNEQGNDLLDWLADTAAGRPLLLSGDFNAEPVEPVYQSVTNHDRLDLRSAYKFDDLECDEYTTWKIRETGEQKYVLDYIFHSEALRPVAVLEMPSADQVGENRLPSLQFASDHLSLVADFSLQS